MKRKMSQSLEAYWMTPDALIRLQMMGTNVEVQDHLFEQHFGSHDVAIADVQVKKRLQMKMQQMMTPLFHSFQTEMKLISLLCIF